MDIELKINSVLVDVRKFSKFEMSVSSARPRYKSKAYELSIPQNTFFNRLQGAYIKCIYELRRDDQLTGELDAFGRLDYPPFDELAAHGDIFKDTIDAFFIDDIFNLILPKGKHAVYWIDTLEKATVDGGMVILQGQSLNLK